jgi:hypothetical protein
VDQVHIRRTSIPLGQQIPQTRSVLDAILERVDVDVTINSLAVAGEQADAVAPVKTPAQLVRVTEGFIAVAIDAVIELGSLAPVEPASPYPAGGRLSGYGLERRTLGALDRFIYRRIRAEFILPWGPNPFSNAH